jgi:hypothetical protein
MVAAGIDGPNDTPLQLRMLTHMQKTVAPRGRELQTRPLETTRSNLGNFDDTPLG